MEKNGLNLTGERIFWMDVVRFVAILLVVFTHAHCWAGLRDIAGDRTHDIIITSLFFSVDRWGVVLFLMLSGALMFTKQMQCPFGFRWHRIFQFIALTPFWSVITNISFYIMKQDKSLWEAIRMGIIQNNVLWGGDTGEATHLWYMFLIILFYVALPFLAAMIKNLSCKEVGLYVCWSLFLFILPSLYHWGGTISQTTFLDRLFKDFFSMGLSYFFVGWLACQDTCVSRWLTAHPQKGTALLVGILGLCVLLPLLYEYLHHASMPYLHDTWQSPFVFAGGIALFLLLQQHGEGIRCGRSLISGVAKASFGIFLVHFLFLFPLVEFIPRWIGPCSKDVMTFILFFFDFFLGWGLTVILVQFKLTKWLVA